MSTLGPNHCDLHSAVELIKCYCKVTALKVTKLRGWGISIVPHCCPSGCWGGSLCARGLLKKVDGTVWMRLCEAFKCWQKSFLHVLLCGTHTAIAEWTSLGSCESNSSPSLSTEVTHRATQKVTIQLAAPWCWMEVSFNADPFSLCPQAPSSFLSLAQGQVLTYSTQARPTSFLSLIHCSEKKVIRVSGGFPLKSQIASP